MIVFDQDEYKHSPFYKTKISQMNMKKLDEVTRKNLVGKTIYQSKARYNKRKNYRVSDTFGVDVRKFIENDFIAIRTQVGDYFCIVAFEGVIEELIEIVQQRFHNNLTWNDTYKALYNTIDKGDIYVDCECKDYCLHEDTKIKLLNGVVDTIKNIKDRFDKGEELYVYSTDENGDFKPGKVSDVWISGHVNDMVKITLDNGKEIITTPDHKYMLRNGEYEQAQNLQAGASLMPLYFSYSNGYENVMLNSKPKSFVSVYKTVSNALLCDGIEEARERSGEDRIAIHHKDFNKLNNYPSNLQPMGFQEHYLWHSHNATKDKERLQKFIQAGRAYWDTPEGKAQKSQEMSKNIRKFWDGLSKEERSEFVKSNMTEDSYKKISEAQLKRWSNYSPEEYQAICEILADTNRRPEKVEASRRGQFNAWQRLSPEDRKARGQKSAQNLKKRIDYSHTEEQNKKIGIGQSKYMQSLGPEGIRERNKNLLSKESQIKSLRSKAKKVFDYIVENHLDLNEETYEKCRVELRNGKVCYPKLPTIFDSLDEAKKYYGLETYNHQVKSVEFIHYDEAIPVYDLTVDEYNNFYVDAGVILHNCYRFKYWASRMGYQYGKPEKRPARITNPRNNIGSFCKHLTLLLANKRWLKKCANVVHQIIKDNVEEIREIYHLDEDEFFINQSSIHLTKRQKNPHYTPPVIPEVEPAQDENEEETKPEDETEVEADEQEEIDNEEENVEEDGEE